MAGVVAVAGVVLVAGVAGVVLGGSSSSELCQLELDSFPPPPPPPLTPEQHMYYSGGWSYT